MFDDMDFDALEKRDADLKAGKQVSPYELEMQKMRDDAFKQNIKELTKALDVIAEDSETSESSDFVDKFNEKSEQISSENKTPEQIAEEELAVKNAKLEAEKLANIPSVDAEAEKKRIKDELLAEMQSEKDAFLVKQQELDEQIKATKAAYDSIMESKNKEAKEKEVAKQKLSDDEDDAKQLQDIKAKTKLAMAKIAEADDEGAAEELSKLMMEIRKEAKSKPAKEVDFDKLLEEKLAKKMQEQQIAVSQAQFIYSRDSFFKHNEEILKDPFILKVYKANFEELQNSGQQMSPEDLFKKAKEITDHEISSIRGQIVQKPNESTKVALELQQKSQKDIDAKAQAVKAATASKSEAKTVNTIGKSQHDNYLEMLARQGIKFK